MFPAVMPTAARMSRMTGRRSPSRSKCLIALSGLPCSEIQTAPG